MTSIPVVEPAEPEAAPRSAPRAKRGMTPKQTFQAIAVVLILALIALIIYLLFFMGAGIVQRGGSARGGLRPILTITGPGVGPYPRFDRPMGAAYGLDGRIYVVDTGHNRVCVFTSSGRFLFEFGTFGATKTLPGAQNTWAPGKLNYPVGIDIDSDGSVYVADFRNDQIQVFDSGGKPLRAFPDPHRPTGKGSSGEGGRGIAVTDVHVRDGQVYATDVFQVFVFDLNGKLLRQFGKPGLGKGDLDHPNGVAVDEDGRIYLSDSNHGRVTAFDKNGRSLWNLGRDLTADESKSAPLTLPRGLVVTEDDEIMVIDALDSALVRISRSGKLLDRYGERGVDPAQLNYPNDVDAEGKRLLIADKENSRVQVVEIVGR